MKIQWLGAAAAAALLAAGPTLAQVIEAPIVKLHAAEARPGDGTTDVGRSGAVSGPTVVVR